VSDEDKMMPRALVAHLLLNLVSGALLQSWRDLVGRALCGEADFIQLIEVREQHPARGCTRSVFIPLIQSLRFSKAMEIFDVPGRYPRRAEGENMKEMQSKTYGAGEPKQERITSGHFSEGGIVS
jgi:hypothetical protein